MDKYMDISWITATGNCIVDAAFSPVAELLEFCD